MEELFQLELDRQQGNVSAAETATAKAALDEADQARAGEGERVERLLNTRSESLISRI